MLLVVFISGPGLYQTRCPSYGFDCSLMVRYEKFAENRLHLEMTMLAALKGDGIIYCRKVEFLAFLEVLVFSTARKKTSLVTCVLCCLTGELVCEAGL